MSVGGDESFAELPSQKEQRACRHRQAKKNRQASFELNFRLPGPVAIHGGKLFKVRGQVARFADRPPKRRATRLGGHPGRVVGGYLGGLELGWSESQRGVSLS